jgi:hypothetical protein
MEYTLESTQRLAEELRAIPPKDPAKRRLDKQEVVRELAQEIVALQQRGYTIEEVAESLRGRGLEITTPTLKNYLQRAKGKDGKRRKERRPPGPRRARAAAGEAATSAPRPGLAAEKAASESALKTPVVTERADASAKPTLDPALRSGKGAFLIKDKESY